MDGSIDEPVGVAAASEPSTTILACVPVRGRERGDET